MRIKSPIIISSLLLSFNATAYTFSIDELQVMKNGSLHFSDNFADGTAPPSGANNPGGNPLIYDTRGDFTESNGKAFMDSNLAELASNNFGETFLVNRARLETDTSDDLSKGYKIDDTLSFTATFDLTSSILVGEMYGLGLTDRGGISSQYDDTLRLMIQRDSATTVFASLLLYNEVNSTISLLDSLLLDLNHDQIALRLEKQGALSSTITASFAYLDAGVIGSYETFDTQHDLFNGEDYTQVHFLGSATVVPVPSAVWLFGSGLVGLIGVAKRKKLSLRNTRRFI